MQYFRFNTEFQSSEAQELALSDHIASLPTEKEVEEVMVPIDNSAYIEGTTSWATVLQRTTNTDFVFAICEHVDRGWDIVEIDNNSEWPTTEEI